MLAIFELKFNDLVRPVAIIVLGSDDAKRDIYNLLEYAKSSYVPVN